MKKVCPWTISLRKNRKETENAKRTWPKVEQCRDCLLTATSTLTSNISVAKTRCVLIKAEVVVTNCVEENDANVNRRSAHGWFLHQSDASLSGEASINRLRSEMLIRAANRWVSIVQSACSVAVKTIERRIFSSERDDGSKATNRSTRHENGSRLFTGHTWIRRSDPMKNDRGKIFSP